MLLAITFGNISFPFDEVSRERSNAAGLSSPGREHLVEHVLEAQLGAK